MIDEIGSSSECVKLKGGVWMSLTYGVISITALVLLVACIIVDRKKEKWLRLLFVSVFIANLGYFLLSVSKTLDFALLSNRIVYAGNVFFPFFMLMIILNLCGTHYPKWLPVVLSVVGFAVFVLAASPGYLTVYDKTVSFEIVNGTALLVREYGSLHILYYIYLFLYFAAMLTAIVCSIKKRKISACIEGIILLSAVFIDSIVWLVEHFCPREFEFLSIAYILSESLILVLYSVFRKYNIKRRVICVWTLVFTGVGIALACKFVLPEDPEYYFFSLIRSFIYMGMYYAWGRIVCHGIIQKVIRRCSGGVSILLVFWIAVSMCKHLVFMDNVTIVRYLWYAYYIPQIMIAVLGLNIAIMAGGGENVKLGKGGMVLLGMGAALILLVLTNDLHQIVFSFPKGVPWTNASCTHEAGYYVIMALIVLCAIAISTIMVLKCRIPKRKKFTPLPFLCVIFMVIYGVMYFVDGSIVRNYLNDMTASGCLMVAVLFELVIESGLFQTNITYENLFQSAVINVQLADREHQVRYSSEGMGTVPKEILMQADKAPVMLDQSVRLSGAAIRGGHIYWQEDVSELLSVQKDLEMTREELRDTGDVLKAEAEQKAYQLHLEEENRLYDLVETQTASQVAILRKLTTQLRQTEDLDEAKCLLGKIVIVGTYIKRRSDLILVSGQKQSICKEELLIGIREFAENLKLYGVECAARILNCERFLTDTAGVVYDVFEAVVEEGIDTISAILLCLEMQGSNLLLTICADCSEDLTILRETFSNMTVRQDEDGLWYLNRVFEEGGIGL